MKLIKRSTGEAEDTPQEEVPQKGGRKPVIVYIMILFIVAFILMAVSFIMHQRTNTEEIGKLRDSVSALQEVQKTEDKNIKLQEKLNASEKKTKALEKDLEKATESQQSASNKADALLALYTLSQQYATQNYDACKTTISSMEEKGLDKLLPADSENGVTSPAQRYLQLREVISSK